MSNVSYTNRKLVLAFSSAFKTQEGYDIAMPTADINARHPMATPAFHALQAFREQTKDCGGEFVIIEKITGKIAKFTIGFDATAKLIAGWYALLKGVSAAPTGTPADETQTLDLNGATALTYKLRLDFEGLAETTGEIAFDATNGEIQAALEAIRPIKVNNVTVGGTDPKTITFVNDLAKANIPLLTVVDDTTTGGSGVTLVAGANGDNKLHLITAEPAETPVLFSLIEGFEGDTVAKEYKNLVVNDWTISAPRRGKVTLTITAFGDPDGIPLTDYDMPACVTQTPMLTRDIRVKIGSDWITSDLREMTFTESNNIDVSEDALRFDDVTPDRLERGDRTATLNLLSLGSPTSDMYEFAEDEDDAFAALTMAFGRPGERLTVYGPNTQFRLDDSLIEFVGNRNKSAFRLLGRPSPDNTDVVTRGEYHGANTVRFLVPST